jgi:hypothetical protein
MDIYLQIDSRLHGQVKQIVSLDGYVKDIF